MKRPVLGSMRNWLTAAEQGTPAQAKVTAAGLKAYMAGMKAPGNENAIDNSQEGWDAGLAVNWAIKQAGSLDETTIMHKLQHLNINTLGHCVEPDPVQLREHHQGAGRHGGHQPRRLGGPLQAVGARQDVAQTRIPADRCQPRRVDPIQRRLVPSGPPAGERDTGAAGQRGSRHPPGTGPAADGGQAPR